MDMVNFAHMLIFQEFLFNLFLIHTVRNTVHGEAQAIRQQFPRGDENNRSDDEADDRVHHVPTGIIDDNSADDYAYRDKRVGYHVQEGTSDVEVVLLSVHQQESRQTIDEYSHAGRPRHGDTVHLGGFAELMNTLDDDSANCHEQNDGIEQRDQYGRFAITVGVAFVAVHFRKAEGHQH